MTEVRFIELQRIISDKEFHSFLQHAIILINLFNDTYIYDAFI